MTSFINLIATIVRSRHLIQVMGMREIKLRYTGSILGLFWAVVHPAVLVTLYWFVFTLGLKVQPAGNVPFVVWFFCAFAPWLTFSDMVLSVTPCIVDNRALIKKTVFPSEIFPFVYITSTGIAHLIMLGILACLLLVHQLPITLYAFQLVYYWMAMACLMIGLGWFCSAVNVVSRDMGQVVSVFMQIWFWSTPIIWGIDMLPEKFHPILKLNPMSYIVQGYRDTFIYFVPFWRHLQEGAVFWVETLIIFAIGGLVFRKFKQEFADSL